LATLSVHHPFELPPGYQPPALAGRDAEHTRYLQLLYYADHQLGEFMTQVRERLGRGTVFLILGDHGLPCGEHKNQEGEIEYLYEENLRVPLLLYAPGRLEAPLVIDDVASEMDLVPTIMDILGLTGVHHAVGVSLARVVPDREAHFNNPFGPRFIGMRAGPFKYIWTVDEGREELYDVVRDPGEQINLAQQLPGPTARLRQRARHVQELFMWATQNARYAPLGPAGP
jgi:arylsulfatase A-like enzyme